jgi:hypothetical protein
LSESHTRDDVFYDQMRKGDEHRDIVKFMLEQSGYSVHPYGYEQAISSIKSKLGKNARSSKTVRRIRSSPDLLVYDEQKNDLMLVEVKMRNSDKPKIAPELIDRIKEFWNDTVLVLVVPYENVFYAQRISELETKPVYYRLADFEKFQDIFTRVKPECISRYREIAREAVQKHGGASLDE